MSQPPDLALLQPGKIGPVETRNRFIRSATAESMADENGFITEDYIEFHRELARFGVGLIFTGHCSVHPRGGFTRRMAGLYLDDHVGPFRRLTDTIHAEGSRIFAQVNHAGFQTRMTRIEPLAPSPRQNPNTGKTAKAATEEEIAEIIDAFGNSARRVLEAGFDGVHLHAGHGYLISQFLSPHANRREDAWGGSPENRRWFLLEVVRAMRKAVGEGFPLTVKFGVRDYVEDGMTREEGLAVAVALEGEGVDALEPSAGLTAGAAPSAWLYPGVTRWRALQDKLFHRVFANPVPESYFLEETRRVRDAVGCPVIAVGGLRTVEGMDAVIREGVADFVSLGRPFIREPDLVRKIERGKRGLVDCTSCNLCARHQGVHPLKCWRNSNKDLLVHAWYALTGRLH